ncbi:MAG: hypothetical protein AAF790_00835 [Planctomycetota bacterium]
MSSELSYEANEADYADAGAARHRGGSRPNDTRRKKPEMGRKRGRTPASFNGMHRRRRRKMAW